MKRIPMKTVLAAVTMTALGGCASQQGEARRDWRIEPVMHVRHSSVSSEAFYLTGRYYDGMRRWDAAAEQYRKAVAADPRHVDASNALGVALARQGDLDGAEAQLRRAVALDPARADVRSNLGYVLLLAGRPADAVGELRAAVTMDGSNALARSHLREARQRAGDSVAADAAGAAHSAALVSAPDRLDTAVAEAVATSATALPASGASGSAPAPASSETVAAMQVIDRPTASWSTEATAAAASSWSSEVQVEDPPAPRPPARPAPMLEISNGNGVTGAADRLRRWLADRGIATQRLSNQKPYVQPSTVVQYRGDREDDARRLARTLADGVVVEHSASLRTDLRVLIGRDWQRVTACLERPACASALPLQLADAAAAR
jgi:tetratricopeptide (TPR) repeat protein